MPKPSRHPFVAAAIVAAALSAPRAHALQGYANGHLLNAWCAREETVDVEACLSYLRGVFDTIAAVREAENEAGDVGDICIPEHVPVTQLRIVFRRFARDNPNRLHVQAAVAVMWALREAFPCRDE